MKVKVVMKNDSSISMSGKKRPHSLFVSFDDTQIYDNIRQFLEEEGADSVFIDKFFRVGEYNGVEEYAFGLNCSRFTFNRVERFSEIDAKIDFKVSEKGYINAKIAIIDGKEQILSYTPPVNEEEKVDGWACAAPEPTKTVDETDENYNPFAEKEKTPDYLTPPPPEQDNDLPF